MKKVILPFEEKPYISMYQVLAFPTGIIQGNAKFAEMDFIPWLCGKYINCHAKENSNEGFTISTGGYWGTMDQILWQEHLELFPKMFKDIFGDPIDFFKDMLASNRYVYGFYNEEHIQGKSCYHRRYYKHDFLLIGYDDYENVFHSVGYLSDHHFQKFDIPYKDMRKALDTCNEPRLSLDFWKYNPDAVFTLNFTRMVRELGDYLNGVNSFRPYEKNSLWGQNAIRHLIKCFYNTSEERRYIDHRYTRGVMEHKFVMKLRVEYLLRVGYLSDEKYAQYAEQIYKMAQSAHMLGLKYSITGKESTVRALCDSIEDILERETEYLPRVLADLKAYSKEGEK